MPSAGVVPKLSLSGKTTTVAVVTVGLGSVILWLLNRWFWRRYRSDSSTNSQSTDIPLIRNGDCRSLERPDSSRALSRMRFGPSFSERGSARGSMRQRTQHSVSLPPVEADLMFGSETCQDLLKNMERALCGLELVKNRSDKDRTRAEMLSSVIDRLRVLETDLSRLVADSGLLIDDKRDDAGMGGAGSTSSWAAYQSPRAGTLSVLSDDSFMSAFEEFPVSMDDDDVSRDIVHLAKDQLLFLQAGMRASINGEVTYRRARTEFCQCDSENDFAGKLWCLRQAFEPAHVFQETLRDEHRRVWLAKSGRTLLGDILKHSKQDTSVFYKTYDEMLDFFRDETNVQRMEEELGARRVTNFGFYDIVFDFILLDAFDDMRSPPSAIYSVTKNFFLSQSMKYSTISTIIWSMLKAKRQRLNDPSGFIAHFYNISEAVSPAITLGFLGTDERIGELCQYFKEQITLFLVDIFSTKRVRYTSLEDLSEDVWSLLQTRTEAVLTRLSTELVPA